MFTRIICQRAVSPCAASFSTLSRSLRSQIYQKKTVDLIGCPFRGGQPKGGVDKAPEILRNEGNIVQEVSSLGWIVNDLGDVNIPALPTDDTSFLRVKNPHWVGEVSKRLADKVHESSSQAHLPLVIGGDHSIAVGTISGMCRTYPNLGVLWVDAHADINTSGSTPSGNMHGMPVSFLMGLTKSVPGFEWIDLQQPPLARDQLVYIGLRSLEHQEKAFLNDHNIKAFDMHAIDKYGIGNVLTMAMKILGDRPLHISFDIDALDPREAPATGTPVRGGLTFREGAYLCEYVHDSAKLVSMELVEVNPALGGAEDVSLTMSSGVSMIKAALGETLT